MAGEEVKVSGIFPDCPQCEMAKRAGLDLRRENPEALALNFHVIIYVYCGALPEGNFVRGSIVGINSEGDFRNVKFPFRGIAGCSRNRRA